MYDGSQSKYQHFGSTLLVYSWYRVQYFKWGPAWPWTSGELREFIRLRSYRMFSIDHSRCLNLKGLSALSGATRAVAPCCLAYEGHAGISVLTISCHGEVAADSELQLEVGSKGLQTSNPPITSYEHESPSCCRYGYYCY